MGTFWDKDNPSEYEELQETIEEQAQTLLDEMDEEEMEEEFEEEYDEDFEEDQSEAESAYNLNNRENSIVNESAIRLEQARLYDMLIKHDMFAGVKAHPKALRNVKAELKRYIVERLEILLGIKQEKIQQAPKQMSVEFPLNDVEIEFLKALSFKGTKGASAGIKQKRLIANEIQPLGSVQESQGLRPLVEEEVEEELAPIAVEEVQVPVRPKRKVPAKKPLAAPPVKRTAKKTPARKAPAKKKPAVAKKVSKGITRKRKGEMTDAEAEAIALEDLKKNGPGMSKHPYEMDAKELRALKKKLAKQNKDVKVRPAGAKDMLQDNQAQMFYQTQQQHQNMKPESSGLNTLLQKVLHDKNKS